MLRYFRERKRKKKEADDLIRRGVVFEFEEEDLEKAKELYEKALELNPKSITASHRLMHVESGLRVKAARSKIADSISTEELIRTTKIVDKILNRPLSLTPDELRYAREFTDWLETAYRALHAVSQQMDYPNKKEKDSQPERLMKCPSCGVFYFYNSEEIASDGSANCQNCGKVIRIS
ncbi:MAG: tetratricopeptide repeat protein [Candidatus Thorarchaeota archaeon]